MQALGRMSINMNSFAFNPLRSSQKSINSAQLTSIFHLQHEKANTSNGSSTRTRASNSRGSSLQIHKLNLNSQHLGCNKNIGWDHRSERHCKSLLKCRAGHDPIVDENDELTETVRAELDMESVMDGWQWTKTNQELVCVFSQILLHEELCSCIGPHDIIT